MSELTLTELIDSEVLNTNGQYFRNHEICEATGASRAHVSQRMKKLYNDGVIDRNGRDWHVVNQGLLLTTLLRSTRYQELETTKLLKFTPAQIEALIEAITLLKNSRNNWEASAHRLEDALLEEINKSLETLRELRARIRKPVKSNKQVFAHMMQSGKYAQGLENTFKDGSKVFLGQTLETNVIIDDIRDPALERKNNA